MVMTFDGKVNSYQISFNTFTMCTYSKSQPGRLYLENIPSLIFIVELKTYQYELHLFESKYTKYKNIVATPDYFTDFSFPHFAFSINHVE